MVTLSISEPQLRSTLNVTTKALRRPADYELDTVLARRMELLSERTEFLNEQEHAELLGLVEFSRRRTFEKLEAQPALKQWHEIAPEMDLTP